MKLIFALIVTGLLAASVAHAEHTRLISVTGSAEKSFGPDIAFVQISVWGKGESAKSAQNLSSKEHEHLAKILDQYKIQKEDIQTLSYDLNPEYFYDQKTNINKIVGHTASQVVSVKLRKISEIGKFLDDVVTEKSNTKSGTNINLVSWDVEKRKEISAGLLNEAVLSAQELAQNLAKAAGVKVKNLYRLAPQEINNPIPMFRGDAVMAAPMMEKSAPATNLSAGEVKIKAFVTADYEIE